MLLTRLLISRPLVLKFCRESSYMQIFNYKGDWSPNPCIIQGSTVYSKFLNCVCSFLTATKKDQIKSTKIIFSIFVSKATFYGTIFQIQFLRTSAEREVNMNILKNKHTIFKVSFRHAVYTISPPEQNFNILTYFGSDKFCSVTKLFSTLLEHRTLFSQHLLTS